MRNECIYVGIFNMMGNGEHQNQTRHFLRYPVFREKKTSTAKSDGGKLADQPEQNTEKKSGPQQAEFFEGSHWLY